MCPITIIVFFYVNSLVEKLRGAGVGVECRGWMVTALLYANDAVLFAENEEERFEGVGGVVQGVCGGS